MNADEAMNILSKFEEYFNEHCFTHINKGSAENSELIGAIVNYILLKFPKNSKISFDPKSRTMLLILLRALIYSSSANAYYFELNKTNVKRDHTIGSLQYNLWMWVLGLINEDESWEDIATDIEIIGSVANIANIAIKNEKMNGNSVAFAQIVFMKIIDIMSSKMARLYSKTHEWGASGVTIKSYMLCGLWTDMNPGAANPEIFEDIQRAAVAFEVVKKGWIKDAKEAAAKKARELKDIKKNESTNGK